MQEVAASNINHSYTKESLQADLLEVDFEPEQIISCGANKGAFVLVFAKTYEAKALATALDRIDPEEKVVQSCGNSEAFPELVRVIESEDELAPPQDSVTTQNPDRVLTSGLYQDSVRILSSEHLRVPTES